MKITIVMGPYHPVPGYIGAEVVHLALAEEFSARGHDVTLISRRFADLPHEEVRAGVRHFRIPSSDVPPPVLFRLYDYLYSRRAARILPMSDITVTNSVFLPVVLPKARAGHIYVHAARYPKWQMWLYLRASRIQAVSHAVAAAIKRQTPPLANRLVVIPPPVVLGQLVSADRLYARPPIILYVGRIAREKGVHILVKAFARLANGPLAGYKLKIVGPHERRQGGDGAAYLEYVKSQGASAGNNIIYEGFIESTDDLRAAYEAADIFVYPSMAEKGESFGIAPIEAMAAGCRVIVSNLECFRDYLEPGINGLVFDHRGDAVGALAAALVSMASRPDARRMREAGLNTAARFQLKTIATAMLDDFNKLLNERLA